MIKFLKAVILISILSYCFVSCRFEEEDIFENSAAERISIAQQEYTDILCSASNGWVVDYFPTVEKKGYTFLMKFLPSTLVEMASKNETTGNAYKADSCMFQLIGDNGPVLTLNTFSEAGTFHLFSSPEKNDGGDQGVGYGGDYEFIVISATSDNIVLKGKKRGVYVHMRKLGQGIVWRDYFTLLDNMNSNLFSAGIVHKLVVNNQEAYKLSNGTSGIYNFVPKGGDDILDVTTHPFIVTDFGIRFVVASEADGVSFQNFRLNDDKSYLVSEESSSAYIATMYEGVNFIPNFIVNKYGWNINLSSVSADLGSYIARVNAVLVSFGGTNSSVSSLRFLYNSARSSYVLRFGYLLSGTLSTEDFDFDITTSGDQITFTYKGTHTTGGTQLLNVLDGLPQIMTELSGTSSIESMVFPFNPTKGIKLTKTANSASWINITGGTY